MSSINHRDRFASSAARARAQREADLFLIDLYRSPPPGESIDGDDGLVSLEPLPPFDAEEDPADWSEWLAELPPHYRRAYARAQQAHLALPAEEVDALALDLLSVQNELEMEGFFDSLSSTIKSATKIATTATKVVGDVSKAVAPVAQTVSQLAGKSPLGDFARATYGAATAATKATNIAAGALDGLAKSKLLTDLVRVGTAVGQIKGTDLAAAAKMLANVGLKDMKAATQLASMVAPFVPGVGTGVAAAIGAANALASGKPITTAVLSAVRSAIPGGAAAQAAFDVAAGLASGKRIDQALLAAARNRLPAGVAQAAFDTGLAIAQGKKLQDVATGAVKLLPVSPYASDVLKFAQQAMSGGNLGKAALTAAGNALLSRVQQQGGDVVAAVQGRLAPPAAAAPAQPAAPAAPAPDTLDSLFAVATRDENNVANQFLAALVGSKTGNRS
jgi:hypothetical protein